MRLESFKEGEYYLSSEGEVFKVTRVIEQRGVTYPIETQWTDYTEKGNRYIEEESEGDLIAHIPAAVMLEFYRIIEQYHINSNFRGILDKCYQTHLDKARGNQCL